MRRISRLKREARVRAKALGHLLTRFKSIIKGKSDPMAESQCFACGMSVRVDHNGSVIDGPAVTRQCEQMQLFERRPS